MYQAEEKHSVAKAMDVPFESVNLYYAAWAAIRDAFARGDLVGTRRLIESLTE